MPKIVDTVHAFMPYPFKELIGNSNGPLSNTSFAVKDLFDVVGYPTGCGCPLKLAESQISTNNAEVVNQLLNAGAIFFGKTKTDELAWSSEGINSHFGTPINPKAPERIPGGSSSGSASAVAASLVDFAIGTDTGGSVRLPASFCGLWGIRPTFGRIPMNGCMELAISFDTCGFFARTGAMLESIADVLFNEKDSNNFDFSNEQHILATDMMELAAPHCREILVEKIPSNRVSIDPTEIYQGQKDEIYLAFRYIQAQEILTKHGPWVKALNPPLGYGVAERFKFAEGISSSDVKKATQIRKNLQERLNRVVDEKKVIFTPTVPTEAPLIDTELEDLVTFRHRALSLLCIAGLCGFPQLSIPVATGINGAPIGLSLIGPPNSDRHLIRYARLLFPNL